MAFSVEKLLKRLNIDAKKKGKEWVGKCPRPSHLDKHPSWRMRDDPGSEKHGLFRCWSCGLEGSAMHLVVYLLDLDWEEAREFVYEGAEVASQPLPGTTKMSILPMTRVGFKLPAGTIVAPFESWPEEPTTYAVGRKIIASQTARWGVGYALEGWLTGRIVFPKRTVNGEIKGYSARTFRKQEFVRYLEPDKRESPDFSVMFGEEWWFDRDRIWVSEGAINALALERASAGENIASLSGSDLNPMHAAKLSTFRHVVVSRDPDAAGSKVSNALYAALCRHTRIDFLDMPPGHDPASLEENLLTEKVRELCF